MVGWALREAGPGPAGPGLVGKAGAEAAGSRRGVALPTDTFQLQAPFPGPWTRHFIQSLQGLCELAAIFILPLGPRRLVPGHTGCGYKRWSQAVWPKCKACPPSPAALDPVQARTDALATPRGACGRLSRGLGEAGRGRGNSRCWASGRQAGSWGAGIWGSSPAPRAQRPSPPPPLAQPCLAWLTREPICCCCWWGLIHLRRLCFSSHALLPSFPGLAKFGV